MEEAGLKAWWGGSTQQMVTEGNAEGILIYF